MDKGGLRPWTTRGQAHAVRGAHGWLWAVPAHRLPTGFANVPPYPQAPQPCYRFFFFFPEDLHHQSSNHHKAEKRIEAEEGPLWLTKSCGVFPVSVSRGL